jgi:hypothetical protein
MLLFIAHAKIQKAHALKLSKASRKAENRKVYTLEALHWHREIKARKH